MASFESSYQRYGMNVLGSLIAYVGRRALGKRHLVTLSEPEELPELRYGKIYERIIKAYEALEDCAHLINNGSPSRNILAGLNAIQPAPKGPH
jgi:hypothetical protein